MTYFSNPKFPHYNTGTTIPIFQGCIMIKIAHEQCQLPRKTVPNPSSQFSPKLQRIQWTDTVPLNISKTQHSNLFLIVSYLICLMALPRIQMPLEIIQSFPQPQHLICHQVLCILPQKYILNLPPPVLVVVLFISYCKTFPRWTTFNPTFYCFYSNCSTLQSWLTALLVK